MEEAVRIADAEGLDAVSMRAVAKALDVGTMSLYRHVPGKDELLALMVDRVVGEAPRVGERPGGWRAKLEAYAWAEWQLAHAHPWVLAVPATYARPVAGPNMLAAYESVLHAADETGLPPRDVVRLVAAVGFLADGAARASVDSALAARRTGITNEEWWGAQEAVIGEVFDPERYPTFAALDEAGAFGSPDTDQYEDPIDYEGAFASALDALLDGVEARVQRR
ncbi:TetR/AcrR family transcriptional regulator [Egibacter rhizosphaerae]|uniref:TetR/AcrR family transcriptional regulator n=1 Tax=Egibacter rhizosphaerae TaxID=1670831 RepID=A0A411YF85_9ACTN|nr:TetR/AcrR family transcriptional regulator [Egibacter rhizosphaerae]QBI19895.1 TetR/AcrR family transcriptional regulator [Egibacter rhizosphaerae]